MAQQPTRPGPSLPADRGQDYERNGAGEFTDENFGAGGAYRGDREFGGFSDQDYGSQGYSGQGYGDRSYGDPDYGGQAFARRGGGDGSDGSDGGVPGGATGLEADGVDESTGDPEKQP